MKEKSQLFVEQNNNETYEEDLKIIGMAFEISWKREDVDNTSRY